MSAILWTENQKVGGLKHNQDVLVTTRYRTWRKTETNGVTQPTDPWTEDFMIVTMYKITVEVY